MKTQEIESIFYEEKNELSLIAPQMLREQTTSSKTASTLQATMVLSGLAALRRSTQQMSTNTRPIVI